MPQTVRDYTVESVHRAVRVLKTMGNSPDDWSLAELSRALDLSKPTVFRLLATLMADELVEQDEQTKRYRLGVGLITLGQRAQDSLDLVALARPMIERLVDSFGVVVYLNVPTRDSVLTIERVPRLAGMQFVRAGMTIPFHACASGLLFLAFGNEELIERTIATGMPRYASGTIDSADRLRSEIRTVRELGYACDANSLEEGVRSVALPIFDHSHRIIAAIGITAIAAAHDVRTWDRVRMEGQRVAEEVSMRLGAAGPTGALGRRASSS